MKKSVIIVSHAMEIGGVEKALLGLLGAFCFDDWDVDLFLMHHSGPLFVDIPSEVRVLPEKEDYSCIAVPFLNVIKKRKMGIAWGRIFAKMYAKIRQKQLGLSSDNDLELEYSHKYTWKYMSEIGDKEYDLAVSFLTPHYYTLEKVRARKKIAWIHTDYSKIQVDQKSQYKMWQAYDYIASISDDVTKSFLTIFPALETKVLLFPNIIPVEYLKKKAQEIDVESELRNGNKKVILSIGRFCYAKNFDSIPAIATQLKNQGIEFTWYIIGFGGDEQLIRDKIHEFNADKYVKMLGKRVNPYPYIKACDLYVQPSRYEGKCVSVIEAQILHKPVLITNYPTSSSQLIDGIDGMIVAQDIDSCTAGIKRLLTDSEVVSRIVAGTYVHDYSNKSYIKLLERIVHEDL